MPSLRTETGVKNEKHCTMSSREEGNSFRYAVFFLQSVQKV
jgi:hypothetical protein